MRFALVLLILSVLSSSFWIFGFLIEAITKSEPNLIILLLVSIFIASTTYLAIKKSKLYIAVTNNDLKTWLNYSLFSVISYVLTIPIGIFIGYLYTYFYDLKFEPIYGETSIFIWVSALWLPLWWSPAIGIIWGSYVHSKKHL